MQGFSYDPEEFCVYLVKGYLEVKSVSVLYVPQVPTVPARGLLFLNFQAL